MEEEKIVQKSKRFISFAGFALLFVASLSLWATSDNSAGRLWGAFSAGVTITGLVLMTRDIFRDLDILKKTEH